MPSKSIDLLKEYASVLVQSPEAFLAACTQTSFQGSGPGGQKRNRVYSGVKLTHASTGESVTAAEFRETDRNRKAASRKLRLKIALTVLEGIPEFDSLQDEAQSLLLKPTPDWPAFRAKINVEHVDFPNCVFTVLGLLQMRGGDIAPAAALLDVSNSALIRFIKLHKLVHARVSDLRSRNELHVLK